MMGGGRSSFFENNNIYQSKIAYREGVENHLKYVQRFDRDTTKGIVGGHNKNEFYEYFRNELKLNDSDFIQKITMHPSIDGIIEIEYKVPKLNTKGEETGEYKYFKYPKTVYDPSKITDALIVQWGKEAMEQGVKLGNIKNRKITGFASNGMKFYGYLDDDGYVTNFYPVVD
jgi:hypothetical protein